MEYNFREIEKKWHVIYEHDLTTVLSDHRSRQQEHHSRSKTDISTYSSALQPAIKK